MIIGKRIQISLNFALWHLESKQIGEDLNNISLFKEEKIETKIYFNFQKD
jgi:hypothetical protein